MPGSETFCGKGISKEIMDTKYSVWTIGVDEKWTMVLTGSSHILLDG